MFGNSVGTIFFTGAYKTEVSNVSFSTKRITSFKRAKNTNTTLKISTLFKRAKIFDDFLKDSDLAMKLYQQILLNHRSSIYVAESRLRYRYLRGDNIDETQ